MQHPSTPVKVTDNAFPWYWLYGIREIPPQNVLTFQMVKKTSAQTILMQIYLHITTVDGRNPAPVEVGSLSHYFQGFIHPRWLAGFLNHQQ